MEKEMPDFSHLKKLDLVQKPVAFTFNSIEDSPILMVLSATESNKPFFNAVLKKSRKRTKQVQSGAIDSNFISDSREEDKELYAKWIVKGWSNLKDAQGKSVEYKEEYCLEYLRALPWQVFDELRAFCNEPNNFRDEGSFNVEDTAKN